MTSSPLIVVSQLFVSLNPQYMVGSMVDVIIDHPDCLFVFSRAISFQDGVELLSFTSYGGRGAQKTKNLI